MKTSFITIQKHTAVNQLLSFLAYHRFHSRFTASLATSSTAFFLSFIGSAALSKPAQHWKENNTLLQMTTKPQMRGGINFIIKQLQNADYIMNIWLSSENWVMNSVKYGLKFRAANNLTHHKSTLGLKLMPEVNLFERGCRDFHQVWISWPWNKTKLLRTSWPAGTAADEEELKWWGELKAVSESHLSKQCCQRSHDVVLHHVLTHILTSACTQIPVRQRQSQTHTHHSVRGNSPPEMLFVFVRKCLCKCVEEGGPGDVLLATALFWKPVHRARRWQSDSGQALSFHSDTKTSVECKEDDGDDDDDCCCDVTVVKCCLLF